MLTLPWSFEVLQDVQEDAWHPEEVPSQARRAAIPGMKVVRQKLRVLES